MAAVVAESCIVCLIIVHSVSHCAVTAYHCGRYTAIFVQKLVGKLSAVNLPLDIKLLSR